MKVYSGESIRRIEQACFESGISEARLMENAGSACAKVIKSVCGIEQSPDKSIVILCGKGKNGGDGFVIARKLKEAGAEPIIILTHEYPKIKEPLEMFGRTKDIEIRSLFYQSDTGRSERIIAQADIIVDCIFGIGFHGEADEKTAELFRLVNASGASVISVDVPSGLDSEGRDFDSRHIIADFTIAISALKPVHLSPKTEKYCGITKVVSINIDEKYFLAETPVMCITDGKTVSEKFPKRRADANKGTFGHLMCVCGSYRMPGAAVMSAAAALRSGVGKVTLAFPEKAYAGVASALHEPLFMPLPNDDEGFFGFGSADPLLKAAEDKTAVLIGCGLGRTAAVKNIVNRFIKECRCPLIIDADGINALSDNINILDEREGVSILTPHAGEMARLTRLSISEVLADRRACAEKFVKRFPKCILVLKGMNTVIARAGEPVCVNMTGNAGLSQGGTGDVLAGLMSGFAAQGMSAADAAVCACYIHGDAGDICAEKYSQRGMTTQDLIDALPSSMKKYCRE